MATKRSSGILLYRDRAGTTEFLLVHPGGPYWARRDDGAWSIPKGGIGGDEDWGAAGGAFAREAPDSNTSEREWPPKSGREAEFPEVDRAEWFDLEGARRKLLPAQSEFLDRLLEHL